MHSSCHTCRLLSLSADSGHQEWLVSTGPPLLSSSVAATPPGTLANSDALLPGLDGSLLWLRGQDSDGDLMVERLQMTVPSLVDALPSMAQDGSVLMGFKTSSITAVDPITGATVHTAPVPSESGQEWSNSLLDVPVSEGQLPPVRDAEAGHYIPLLYFGRSYYEVRAMDIATGSQRWNVTYGELRGLGSVTSQGVARTLDAATYSGKGTLAVYPDLSLKWTPAGHDEPLWTYYLPAPLLHAYYGEADHEGSDLSFQKLVIRFERADVGAVVPIAPDSLLEGESTTIPALLPKGWKPGDRFVDLEEAGADDRPPSLTGLSCPLLPAIVRVYSWCTSCQV